MSRVGKESTASPLLRAVWQGSLPLEIRLAPSECRVYDQADPYLVSLLFFILISSH